MTSISLIATRPDQTEPSFAPARPHIAVEILSLLLFAGFAIVSTVMAFVFFWPAGFALAIIMGWFGFGRIQHGRGATGHQKGQTVADLAPATVPRSGNASFDAYRAEMLQRLQSEQQSFERFLDRLRDAKDKSEFDQFMDDRARDAHPMEMSEPGDAKST